MKATHCQKCEAPEGLKVLRTRDRDGAWSTWYPDPDPEAPPPQGTCRVVVILREDLCQLCQKRGRRRTYSQLGRPGNPTMLSKVPGGWEEARHG